jgi:hypothetical protein
MKLTVHQVILLKLLRDHRQVNLVGYKAILVQMSKYLVHKTISNHLFKNKKQLQ